ncbi:TPA: hypothetical protein ACF3TK_004879, partial [Escherichia coli]
CGANQHNHGLLVSWALQGEGMACAPWYVRQRLRRASGRCDSCAALVFSFAPSMPCRALYECNYLYLMVFILKERGKNT